VFKLVFHKLVINTCSILFHIFKTSYIHVSNNPYVARIFLYFYYLFKYGFNFKNYVYSDFWAWPIGPPGRSLLVHIVLYTGSVDWAVNWMCTWIHDSCACWLDNRFFGPLFLFGPSAGRPTGQPKSCQDLLYFLVDRPIDRPIDR